MNLRYVSRSLSLFLTFGLSFAVAAQGIPRPRIDFVYLGGPDCPYCRAWETFDLPKLKASPSFQKVRFTHVAKKIDSPVPSSSEFPADSKHLQEPIAEKLKGGGSPMFAILADGKIIFGWKGTTKYPEEILKIIEELQRLFPTPITPNSSIDRDSPQAARSLP